MHPPTHAAYTIFLANEEEWNRLLAQHPSGAHPFMRWEWKRVFEKEEKLKPFYLIAKQEDQVVALLPGTVRTQFIPVFESQYFGYGGICFSGVIPDSAKKDIGNEFRNYLQKKYHVHAQFFRWDYPNSDAALIPGCNTIREKTYVIQLEGGKEKIWENYSRKSARYFIRKAENEMKEKNIELRPTTSADANAIYALYERTLEQNHAKKKLNLGMLQEAMREENNLLYGFKFSIGKSLMGFCLFAFDARTSSYFIGAASPELREQGLSLHPLIHAGVLEAVARKHTSLNLGGATTKGLQSFKSSFGAQSKSYAAQFLLFGKIPHAELLVQHFVDRKYTLEKNNNDKRSEEKT